MADVVPLQWLPRVPPVRRGAATRVVAQAWRGKRGGGLQVAAECTASA